MITLLGLSPFFLLYVFIVALSARAFFSLKLAKSLLFLFFLNLSFYFLRIRDKWNDRAKSSKARTTEFSVRSRNCEDTRSLTTESIMAVVRYGEHAAQRRRCRRRTWQHCAHPDRESSDRTRECEREGNDKQRGRKQETNRGKWRLRELRRRKREVISARVRVGKGDCYYWFSILPNGGKCELCPTSPFRCSRFWHVSAEKTKGKQPARFFGSFLDWGSST